MNLSLALEELRIDDKDLIIWAGQICINQSDAKEKSDQVRRVKQLYERATRIIAWLGPKADDSSLVIAFLNSVNADLNKRPSEEWLDTIAWIEGAIVPMLLEVFPRLTTSEDEVRCSTAFDQYVLP